MTTVNSNHLLPRTVFSCTDSQVYTEVTLQIATNFLRVIELFDVDARMNFHFGVVFFFNFLQPEGKIVLSDEKINTCKCVIRRPDHVLLSKSYFTVLRELILSPQMAFLESNYLTFQQTSL